MAVLIAIVLTNGLIVFLVIISKMKGVGDVRLESKACIYYAESVKRFCNSV